MNEQQKAFIQAIKTRASKEKLAELAKDLDLNFVDNTPNRAGVAMQLSPLHHAVREGNKNAVELLIQAKVDLNAVDADGNTPLHYAINGLNDDLANILLTANARTDLQNQDGNTTLHLYAKGGAQRGCSLLDNHAAKFNSCLYVLNKASETPLHSAITADNMYFFTYFITPLNHRYYGQIDLKNAAMLQGPNGDNLVHTAVRRLQNKSLTDNEARTFTMIYLLAGVEPDLFVMRNKEGLFTKSPLDLMAKDGSLKIMTVLRDPMPVYIATRNNMQLLGNVQQELNRQAQTITQLSAKVDALTLQLAAKDQPAPANSTSTTSSAFFGKTS